MTRKLLLSMIAVLCFTFFVSRPALAAKSYFAERYDVDVVILPDGTLSITETVVFHFEGGPFTFVNRELKYENLDEIDRVQASMDDTILSQGTQAGQVEIAAGHPLKVTWHFLPTSDTTHEYKLSYRVQGVIRKEATADTLIWRAIPENHDYTINKSSLRIQYPANIVPLSRPTLMGASASFEAGSKAAVFTSQQINKDTPIDVTVHFPSGSLVRQPPAWQSLLEQKEQQDKAAFPLGLGAAVLTGILGLAGVLLQARTFSREASMDAGASQSFSAPPKPIPPALAARLTGSSTTFLGTFFDLARRALLHIEEGPKKWGSRTFEVIRQLKEDHLQPHEQVFMDTLFHKTKNDRVALTEIASLAYKSQFNQALDQELTAAGWRDAPRSDRRGRFLALTGLALGFGFVFLLAGFIISGGLAQTILGAAFIGTGAALSSVGLIGLLVAANISTLSDEGIRQAAAWKGFNAYMHSITRGREAFISPELFERYLPYAASFGMATEWAKTFQKMTEVPIPEWFRGLNSANEDGSFIAIMAAITAADSSASVSGGGDGGGASGGGSSGAG